MEGIRKARVLPLPVLAAANTSLLDKNEHTSQTLIWQLNVRITVPQKPCHLWCTADSPPFQQGAYGLVLDLSHGFKAHFFHSLQCILTDHFCQRCKWPVLKCTWESHQWGKQIQVTSYLFMFMGKMKINLFCLSIRNMYSHFFYLIHFHLIHK